MEGKEGRCLVARGRSCSDREAFCHCQASATTSATADVKQTGKPEIRKEREGTMYARQTRTLLSFFIIHHLQPCWGSRETLSNAQQGMSSSQRRDVGGGSVAYCGSRDNGTLVGSGFSTPRANALTPPLLSIELRASAHSPGHLPGNANTPAHPPRHPGESSQAWIPTMRHNWAH